RKRLRTRDRLRLAQEVQRRLQIRLAKPRHDRSEDTTIVVWAQTARGSTLGCENASASRRTVMEEQLKTEPGQVVEQGHGRLALVSGEAGVGKTAVVDGFCRDRAAELRVLAGGCDLRSCSRTCTRPTRRRSTCCASSGAEWLARGRSSSSRS